MTLRAFAAVALVAVFGGACWLFASSHVEMDVASSPNPTAAQQIAPPRSRRAATHEAEEPKPERRAVVRVVSLDTQVPVAGAAVEIVVERGVPWSGVTDASGVAHFSPIDAEGADVRVRATGFVLARFFANRDQLHAESSPLTIPLAPGVVLEGTVRSEDGDAPVGGAVVVALDTRVFHPPDPKPFLARAETGADGRFRLEGLLSGEPAVVMVTGPGRAAFVGTIDASAGEPTVLRLRPAGRIAGTVVDPAGAAVEGASVDALPAVEIDIANVECVLSAKTDAAGRFEFDSVPLLPAWTLVASKGGLARSEPTEVSLDPSSRAATCVLALRRLARIEVTVTGPGGTPVQNGRVHWECDGESDSGHLDAYGQCVAELSHAGSVKIVVNTPDHPRFETRAECVTGETFALDVRLAAGVSIAGRVTDDLGTALRGARVVVRCDEGFERSERTGADGRFRVDGLEDREYEVEVTAPEHEGARLTFFRAPASDATFALRRMATVALRLSIAPVGEEARGWFIDYVRDDGKELRRDDGELDDAESVVRLSPGRWRAQIRVEGLAPASREFELPPGGRMDLGEIALGRGVVFEGRVEDADGRGVPGATVSRGTMLHVETMSAGTFRVAHAAPGIETVTVSAAGFTPVTLRHSLGSPSAPLVIRLGRSVLLTGTVRTARGEVARGVTVRVDSAGGGSSETAWQAVVDADGRYGVRLPPGRHRVVVERDGIAVATRDVEVGEDGKPVTADVETSE